MPISPWELAWCAAAVLAGYTLRGATGFGAGLIVIPACALVLPFDLVIPLVTAMGVFASFGQTWRERRLVDRGVLMRLVLPTLAGAGIGLALFAALDARVLLKAFGAFIILYALTAFIPLPRVPHTSGIAVAYASGTVGALVATIFGGMAGPFYAVYLDALKLGKGIFRATMSAVLALLALVRIAGYGGLGLFDARVAALLTILVPAMVIAMLLGERLHRRLSEGRFQRVVALVLIASGIALLFK
jgi:uncharacterized membrane protein YfcA